MTHLPPQVVAGDVPPSVQHNAATRNSCSSVVVALSPTTTVGDGLLGSETGCGPPLSGYPAASNGNVSISDGEGATHAAAPERVPNAAHIPGWLTRDELVVNPCQNVTPDPGRC